MRVFVGVRVRVRKRVAHRYKNIDGSELEFLIGEMKSPTGGLPWLPLD